MRGALGTIAAAAALTACGPTAVGPDAATTRCTPGDARCSGNLSLVCKPDGSGEEQIFCDPLQGVACDVDSGRCNGECAHIGTSYIGCDYYPTVTGNEVNSTFRFGVAVSNTSAAETAHVTIEWGGLAAPITFDVPPGEVRTQTLPWDAELKGCMGDVGVSCAGNRTPASVLAPKGAYRLRATAPVTVYQFNPLDYRGGTIFSYTNDASLLLPANALGKDYVVAAWPTLKPGDTPSPGLMAITATADDTQVTITTRAATPAGDLAPAMQADTPETVTLRQGDVLELFNFEGDLSGSRVTSDKPVQVIGGHFCTNIPADVGFCDHVEESMFPVQSLSHAYVVAAPALPTLPDGKVEVVRVIATADATTLTYDPPQAAPTQLARAGDVIELAGTAATFQISSDKKILVAQYMEGQEAAGGMGDPAMALAVPTDQYRTEYLFHAPTNYETNYVDVIARAGAEVTLDGAPLTGMAAGAAVGGTGLENTRVVLGNGPAGDGTHHITCDTPFGISVYGYGQYTSYWYPGGLDLQPIVIP